MYSRPEFRVRKWRGEEARVNCRDREAPEEVSKRLAWLVWHEAECPGGGKGLTQCQTLVCGRHEPGQARLQDGQALCQARAAMGWVWGPATFTDPISGQLCPALRQPAWGGPKDTGHMEKGT